jgi:hypothetical protein
VGTCLFSQQRLTVGDRDAVIIWVNFAKRQKPMPITAIIDKRRLQRRLDPGDLGEVNIAFEVALTTGFGIELQQLLVFHDDHARLLRVAGIY